MKIAISDSDFKKYGCPDCGCTFAYSNTSFFGSAPLTCGECRYEFFLLSDNLNEATFTEGNNSPSKLQKHPREGMWPHDFVRPDIKPKGFDGEFWSPRGVGYDLSGFVKSKYAGERILQMVREVIGREPKTWLDYRENEPLWIQVKVQKEDGFDLEALNRLCKDGVVSKDRFRACLINNTN